MTHRAPSGGGGPGFTLLEILVAVAIGLLVTAVVVPTVLQQFGSADAVRAAEDLDAVDLAVDLFVLDVRRGALPGDLEDLVHRPDSSDADPWGTPYTPSDLRRWGGPYLDPVLPVMGVAPPDAGGYATGYGARVLPDLVRYVADRPPAAHVRPPRLPADPDLPAGGSHDFLAAVVDGFDESAFERVNDLVDGRREEDGPGPRQSQRKGRLRFAPDAGLTFFLVTFLPAR